MISSLTRRAAQPGDAVKVISWFHGRREVASWGGVIAPYPLTTGWIAGEFDKADYSVWGDERSNLCGIFGLARIENTVRIMRFAVAPHLRGQGLGKAMFAEILALAFATGAAEASLSVFGSNMVARSIYEQAGFRVVGERQAEDDPTGISYEMRASLHP